MAYLGKSVSDHGYFILIPMEEPSLHEDYFMAIQSAFNHLGVVIDKSCKDVTRLRIVSYDKTFYMPAKATVINSILFQETKKQVFEFIEHDKLNRLITEIERKQVDLTKIYQDWFSIGC